MQPSRISLGVKVIKIFSNEGTFRKKNMSYTEIYRVTTKGNTRLEGEVQNSHRGAMSVWNYLEEKYLPPFFLHGQKFSRMFGEMQEVWNLSKDPRLTESERICLMSTFDNVVVLAEDIPKLLKAFREFPGNTSLPEQADIIESIPKDKRLLGICWNQTSVNADIPAKNITGKYWSLFESQSS